MLMMSLRLVWKYVLLEKLLAMSPISVKIFANMDSLLLIKYVILLVRIRILLIILLEPVSVHVQETLLLKLIRFQEHVLSPVMLLHMHILVT